MIYNNHHECPVLSINIACRDRSDGQCNMLRSWWSIAHSITGSITNWANSFAIWLSESGILDGCNTDGKKGLTMQEVNNCWVGFHSADFS